MKEEIKENEEKKVNQESTSCVKILRTVANFATVVCLLLCVAFVLTDQNDRTHIVFALIGGLSSVLFWALCYVIAQMADDLHTIRNK